MDNLVNQALAFEDNDSASENQRPRFDENVVAGPSRPKRATFLAAQKKIQTQAKPQIKKQVEPIAIDLPIQEENQIVENVFQTNEVIYENETLKAEIVKSAFRKFFRFLERSFLRYHFLLRKRSIPIFYVNLSPRNHKNCNR